MTSWRDNGLVVPREYKRSLVSPQLSEMSWRNPEPRKRNGAQSIKIRLQAFECIMDGTSIGLLLQDGDGDDGLKML